MRTLVYICVLLGASLFLTNFVPARAQTAARGKIAFLSPTSAGGDLFVLDFNSGLQANVTQGRLAGIASAAWSPDGTRLVVSADRGSNLYVVGADGTGLRALTQNTDFAIAQTPTWSPDGNQIAFVCDASPNYDVCVVGADGGNRRRLTNTNSVYRDLAWSPDGKTLAFMSDRGGAYAVYLMNPDGTGQARATTGTAEEVNPAWRPDPTLAQPTPTPTPVYSVSGRVTDSAGAPVPGVLVTFELNHEGAIETRAAQTDAAGNYSSGDLGCRNGVKVTPSKNGLSFAPQARSFVSTGCLGGGDTADFVATSDSAPRYSISGRVTDGRGNGISDATVTLGGSVSAVTTTDAAGNYSFAGLPAGSSYTLSPSKAGQYLKFSTGVSTLNSNQSGVNLALIPYVTVFVRVTDAAGNAVPGVAVKLGEQTFGAPLTNTNGTVTVNVTYPAVGDTTFKLTPAKYGYAFNPAETSFSTRDGNQSFGFSATLLNQIYDTQFFVRQHYLDFFGREPDAAGLAFWTQGVETCAVVDYGCREVKRIDTSAAFFLSIEFKETGYLVYRTRKAAYGNLPGRPVPLKLSEFTADSQRVGQGVVVNAPGWAELLESNKRSYFDAFVSDPRFAASYPATLTPAQFVDALDANAGHALSANERAALVTGLTDGTMTRAQVLRAVAEDPDFAQAEFNRAFVLMQYFGYLRRDPDAAPDADFTGYLFWLSKLEGFGGDYRRAEMVKAFISSDEYRKRFGQ